jgi:hypothetical protein
MRLIAEALKVIAAYGADRGPGASEMYVGMSALQTYRYARSICFFGTISIYIASPNR